MNKITLGVASILALILVTSLSSAVTITSVNADTLAPGSEGTIRVSVENKLSDTAKDVSLSLEFTNLQFIPTSSSSDSFDELKENDDGQFTFQVRAANTITPGDYQIPYTLTYEVNNQAVTKKGSIGITVRAQPQISFSTDVETPVIGSQGKINLKIVNKGFADARFVSVRITPSGFTLLSEDEIYIGTVSSDDFETANFDVIFKSSNPKLSGIVEYTDFDNDKKILALDESIQVYTKDKAIELGIIKKNNTPLYIGIVIAILVIWLVIRSIRKRRRIKKSKNEQE